MNFGQLRQVINESVGGRVQTDVHEFFGPITESFGEFNIMLHEASLGIDTDSRMGNEILIEAVATGQGEEALAVINESVVSTVIDKVKAFFRKIVEYIKGIIAKIKVYISGMTTHTNKWYGKMKKPVEEAAKNREITKGFEWEGYEWDHSKIDAILDKANAVADVKFTAKDAGVLLDADFSIDTVDVDIKGLSGKYNTSVTKLNSKTKYGSYGSAGSDTSASNRSLEKAMDSYKDGIKSALGISGDLDKFKDTLATEARGSKEVKNLKGIDSKYTKMLEFIDKCSDKLSDISDSYDAVKTKYEKALSALEGDVFKDFDKVDGIDSDNSKRLDEVTSLLSSTLTKIKAAATYGQSKYNDLCSLQLSLTKECAQSYMKVLSRLATAKPAK